RLGAERFAAAVRELDYGNADVSGEPGKGNGLTHSWLNTSLLISPRQQAIFVWQLVTGRLAVSERAAALAIEALPRFRAGSDWTLVGKTGTGYVREANGQLGNRLYGWFVGWGEREDKRL